MFATFLHNKVVHKLVPYHMHTCAHTHMMCVCTSDAANSAQATNSRQFAILSHQLNGTSWIWFLAWKKPMTLRVCCVSWVCDFMLKKVMHSLVPYAHTHTYIHHFNGHFPGQPGSAGCPLDSQSPVIHILNILTEQPKLFIPTGYVGLYPAHLHYLRRQYFKGFWSRSFYRSDAFPVTQPTESKHWRYN